MTHPVAFLDSQFGRRIEAHAFALEAGPRGCGVLTADASLVVVERINRDAAAGRYRHMRNRRQLRYRGGNWFVDVLFPRKSPVVAGSLAGHCRPGWLGSISNVPIECTTYMETFQEGQHTLSGRNEPEGHFAGWRICLSRRNDFDAVAGTRKAFSTVIARKAAISRQ